MNIQDTYDRTVELAKENNGEFSHLNTFMQDTHMWIFFNFQDSDSLSAFIYDLYKNDIGLLFETPVNASCGVFI